MLNSSMTTAEMDKTILERSQNTGYDLREILSQLSYQNLKDYDYKFKQENKIQSELSADDISLLSSVGKIILEEKLNRDRKTVFG